MSDFTDPSADAFHNDVQELVSALTKAFNITKTRFHLNDDSDVLYIEIEGLDSMSESDIEKAAGPILENTELEFEEIMLLPYKE